MTDSSLARIVPPLANAIGDSLTAREVSLELLKLHVLRLNHIEQLLLGMATLAIAGWGFFYAAQTKAKTAGDEIAALGRTLFALAFSGLVGTAFNSLYMGRMGINLNLLRLERFLDPPTQPYERFFVDAGLISSLIVFAVPALFMPALALGAIGFSLTDAFRVIKVRARRAAAVVVAVSVSLPVIFTTGRSLSKVWAVIDFVFKVSPR